jgi:hypothetical protein
MARFRQRVSTTKLTPIGWVVFGLLIAAVAVLILGPHSAEGAALAVAVLVLLGLVAGGLSGGRTGRSANGLDDRRTEFHPHTRDTSAVAPDEQREADLWRREQERYGRTQEE